ncbi:MAG: MATE family efflux transporter [Blautia sp.]
MQATESAISIVLNRGLSMYGGDLYVGSMTILQSVMQLIVIPVQGFTQGVQPIISYNFGARKFDRVKKTYRMTICFTFAVATFLCILTLFFPGLFARIFTTDQELITTGKKGYAYLYGRNRSILVSRWDVRLPLWDWDRQKYPCLLPFSVK